MPRQIGLGDTVASLKYETFDKARQAAPGWDPYYLESEWRAWIKQHPQYPDAAFIGFCRNWFEKKGYP